MTVLGRFLRNCRWNEDAQWLFVTKAAEIRLRRRDVIDTDRKSVEPRVDGPLPHAARIFGCEGMTTRTSGAVGTSRGPLMAGTRSGIMGSDRTAAIRIAGIWPPTSTRSQKRKIHRRDTRASAGRVQRTSAARSPRTGPCAPTCARTLGGGRRHRIGRRRQEAGRPAVRPGAGRAQPAVAARALAWALVCAFSHFSACPMNPK